MWGGGGNMTHPVTGPRHVGRAPAVHERSAAPRGQLRLQHQTTRSATLNIKH